jgi:anion transporter
MGATEVEVRWGRLLFAAAAYLAVRVAPAPEGLTASGQQVLAIVAAAVVLWATEALPVALSSLLLLILLGTSAGLPSLTQAFVGFTSPVVFFLLGVQVISVAVLKSGLAARAARLFLARARGRPGRLLPQLASLLPGLALILPSAITRNAVLVPAYQQVFRRMGVAPDARVPRAIMLFLGVLHPLFSSAFLTGGTSSMTTATLVGGVSWWRWFALMSVPYYALLLLGGTALWLLLRRAPAAPLGPVASEPRRPITAPEARAILAVALASALWLTDFWHGWSPAIPALVAAVLLLVPGVGVLTWKDFEQGTSWGIFFVLGASLSLASALVSSGAAAYFARLLTERALAAAPPPAAVAAGLVAIAALVHLGVTNIAACLALLIPIVATLAAALGLDPLACSLILNMAVDAVIFYPVQTATSLIVYEAGGFAPREVFLLGWVMLALTAGVVVFVAIPYWRWWGLPLVLRAP